VNFITPVDGAQAAAAELFPEVAENQLIFPNDETLSRAHIFRTLDSAEDQEFNADFQRVQLGA
jgi:spermidine/putrescine transport system substrate-binding protein